MNLKNTKTRKNVLFFYDGSSIPFSKKKIQKALAIDGSFEKFVFEAVGLGPSVWALSNHSLEYLQLLYNLRGDVPTPLRGYYLPPTE